MGPRPPLILGAISIRFAGQSRQAGDVDGNSPGLVLGQHLCLQRFSFAVSETNVRDGVTDDIAAGQRITSSAVVNSVWGMVRPRVLAVLRLMTNSGLVALLTGRSPGFWPLRMRPA
jgi:hypothetical protein